MLGRGGGIGLGVVGRNFPSIGTVGDNGLFGSGAAARISREDGTGSTKRVGKPSICLQ